MPEVTSRPLLWREDEFAKSFDRLDCSRAAHAYAGRCGWACSVKRSSIDGRYFAEVNRVVTDGAGRYLHTVYNVKMGTGDTPLHAALDGYRQVAPEHSSYWAVVGLELEAEMLRRAVVRARAWESRLDAAVDALAAAIGLFR